MSDNYLPDPENPSRRIPAPEGMIPTGNGSLEIKLNVNRDGEQKDAVVFSINTELSRSVYFAPEASGGDTCTVLNTSVGPFRVRERIWKSQ